MKKWLVSLLLVVAALVAVGTVTAFALTNGDGHDSEVTPGGEVVGDELTGRGAITIIDDMDPNECNLIHNINACTQEELEALGTSGDTKPVGDGDPEPTFIDDEAGGLKVVTIIDDMDPNECNLIHNINACTKAEMETLGISEVHGPTDDGDPEPLFLDDEPRGKPGQVVVGVLCGDGQTAWITSDGESGCSDSSGTPEGEEVGNQASEEEPPQILPTVLPAKE